MSVCLSVCPSVCPGVTSQYRSKTRWDRDFGFSPYDSLKSLAFRDKISCHWMTRIPTNEGEKEGYPLKRLILPLLARLTWKWLQISTNMLLIITSTSDELLRNVNIDDFEWPWTPKISEFFAILGCNPNFKSELRHNSNLRKKFSALNVDFSNPSSDPLGSKRPAHAGVKEG